MFRYFIGTHSLTQHQFNFNIRFFFFLSYTNTNISMRAHRLFAFGCVFKYFTTKRKNIYINLHKNVLNKWVITLCTKLVLISVAC